MQAIKSLTDLNDSTRRSTSILRPDLVFLEIFRIVQFCIDTNNNGREIESFQRNILILDLFPDNFPITYNDKVSGGFASPTDTLVNATIFCYWQTIILSEPFKNGAPINFATESSTEQFIATE